MTHSEYKICYNMLPSLPAEHVGGEGFQVPDAWQVVEADPCKL